MKHKTKKNKRKIYKKPEIVSEKIIEKTTLLCGKCETGPEAQAGCVADPLIS